VCSLRTSLLLCAASLLLVGSAPAVAGVDDGATVVFVITDADGGVVAGADVGIWDDEELLDAETDDAGVARLTDVAAGAWTAWAAAEGHTGEEQDVVVAAGEETTVRMTLGPGVPFSGRIVDDAGKPVAGAYVKAIAGGTFEGYSELNARPPYDRVYSEDDGTFRIRGIPPGAVSTLVVTADGLAEASLAVRAQGDGVRPSPVEIVLDRGGVVVGRVLGPEGEPVAGATVYVVRADKPRLIRSPRIRMSSSDADGLVMATTTQADADGAFEVIGLAFGTEVVVFAEARGFARSALGEPLTPAETARVVDLTLRLRRPATLEVRLTTPEGERFVDATVRIGEVFDFGPEVRRPDAQGVFRVSGLSAGEVAVHIEPNGYLPQRVTATLVLGEIAEVNLVVDPGATVAGVVRDQDGAPLENVAVALGYEITRADGGWSSGTAGSTKTDAEGRFSIGGLRAMKHTVRATSRGRYALRSEVSVDPPATNFDLVVHKMGSLRVRFESPDADLPVPGRAMVWRHDLENGGASGSTRKLGAGELVLRGGRGELERLSVQFGTFLPFEREIRIPWGEDLDLGTVTLDPGVTVAGRVLDLDGVAVSGALVDWDGQREAVTADDGSFTLAHVPSGAAELTVDADGFLSLETSAPTAADAAPATLTLHRGALVAVRLLDAEGEPRSNFWLQFRRPPTSEDEPKGEHLDEAGTDDDGRFEIRLPVGKTRVLFVTEENIEVLATLDLTEGGSETLTLTLD